MDNNIKINNNIKMDNNVNNINKKNRPIVILSITTAFFAILSILLIVIIVREGGVKEVVSLCSQTHYTEEELNRMREDEKDALLTDIRTRINSGSSMLSILKDYYPDKIVYADNGQYILADINNSLKKNDYKDSGFVKNSDNEITYQVNNSVVSHKGIDVSRYQGNIDFSKVKSSGVEYAFIRCGYRTYGNGIVTEDSSFSTYVSDALKNNIDVGVYFFSQAVTKAEAEEEADFVLNQIKPYNISYPVVIDVEDVIGDTYRTQNLTSTELTDIIIAFCEKIKNAGYTPMIYANLKYFIGRVDMTRLESYEKWFAYYGDTPYFPYDFSVWQYTSTGKVDGISGDVDMNISFKNLKK